MTYVLIAYLAGALAHIPFFLKISRNAEPPFAWYTTLLGILAWPLAYLR